SIAQPLMGMLLAEIMLTWHKVSRFRHPKQRFSTQLTGRRLVHADGVIIVRQPTTVMAFAHMALGGSVTNRVIHVPLQICRGNRDMPGTWVINHKNDVQPNEPVEHIPLAGLLHLGFQRSNFRFELVFPLISQKQLALTTG